MKTKNDVGASSSALTQKGRMIMGSKLNEIQLSAVNCNENKILCLAGAGTGKTFTMIERILHLVEQGVNPTHILVLTFTNAAAFEMKDRYQRKTHSGFIPEFRTFHSFCYHIISTNLEVRRSLGYTLTPSIADDNTRKRIRREAQSITGIKSSLDSLEKKSVLKSDEKFALEMLKKASRKLMQKQGLITFDELCSSICNLFKDNSPLVQKYKDQYEYIFVDEFQDTDSIQYNFVKSFTMSKLFVVGDALQAIYAFRGADSSIIKKLSNDPEWHTIKLYQNYRSTQNICDFANQHSKHASSSFRVAIESGLGEAGQPVIDIPIRKRAEYGEIPEDTAYYCTEDVMIQKGSSAILCRTNREVTAMQDIFKQKNIAFRTAKRTADVQNILLSVGDNEHLLGWLSTYLNAERYADFIRLTTLADESDSSYSITEFIRDFGGVPAVNDRWELVKQIRRICKQDSMSVINRCVEICQLIDCKNLNLDESKCVTMKDGVDHILEVYLGETEEPGTDIYIGTIHSVKGLEFDNVYVVGVNDITFRLTDEENLNLYYVAITRAKKHLVVFERT